MQLDAKALGVSTSTARDNFFIATLLILHDTPRHTVTT